MESSQPVPVQVCLEGVSVQRGGTAILENVTVNFQRSQLTAVIGPNGAGKTTLLLAILGLIPFSGTIRFLGPDDRPIQPVISYVPQNLSFDRQSPISVLEFLALDLQIRPIWLGVKASVRSACQVHLEKFKADHLLERQLGRLSGGEIQRVLLAKALQRNPNLLLLDEPVSGIDMAGGHLFCDILEDIRQKFQLTVLMISHDLSVVYRHATRVLCLNKGVSCEGETPKMLTSEQLLNLYGAHSGLYEHSPVEVSPFCNHPPSHPHSHA